MSWKVKNGNTEPDLECSLVKSPTVYLEPIVRSKLNLLMNKYPHQEWCGYLVGKINGNIIVEDLSIPPHESASSGEATAEPLHTPEACVGFIHSHHSMGAFHSGTDKAYVDGNYPVSITVAKKGAELEFDAISTHKTLCGKRITLNCPVKYVAPKPDFDTEEWLSQAVSNIEKGKRVYSDFQISLIPKGKGYSGYTDYIVGTDGRVLTMAEYQELMKQIYKES